MTDLICVHISIFSLNKTAERSSLWWGVVVMVECGCYGDGCYSDGCYGMAVV